MINAAFVMTGLDLGVTASASGVYAVSPMLPRKSI